MCTISEDPLYTCVHGGPLVHVCTISEDPCTHVYREDPSTARGRHLGWVMCTMCTVHMCTRRTLVHMCTISEDPLYTCVHGGPPVHMCTISEDPLSAARGRHLTEAISWRTRTTAQEYNTPNTDLTLEKNVASCYHFCCSPILCKGFKPSTSIQRSSRC